MLESGVQSVDAFFWERDGDGWGAGLHRVAGTSRNGIWRGVLKVSRCTATAGALRLTVDITDATGNTRTYRRASLAAAGLAHQVAGESRRPQRSICV